jgi:hypothetical protein
LSGVIGYLLNDLSITKNRLVAEVRQKVNGEGDTKSGLTTPFLVEGRRLQDRKEKILKPKSGLSRRIWYETPWRR